jgi:hypothetical protein
MLINSGTFARPINAFKGNVTLAEDKTGPSGWMVPHLQ